MKISPNDTRVKVIHEPREWGIVPEIADFFEGIYRATTAGIHFDVKFVPKFQRCSDKWYLDTPKFFEDVTSLQEARLMTASDFTPTVTPSVDRAGAKESFVIPASPENDPIMLKLANKTDYYVTPKEFYTFRGELATVTDITTKNDDCIKIPELDNLEFVKFIFNKILINER